MTPSGRDYWEGCQNKVGRVFIINPEGDLPILPLIIASGVNSWEKNISF
jgi:hypothetical protein